MLKEDLKIFIKIPTLYTERTVLRRITKSDLEDVYEYGTDPLVPKYLLWYNHPDKRYTLSYLSYLDKMYKQAKFYDWGIELDGKMIGTCGFTSIDTENNSAEIGYVLNSKFWGMGLATEVAKKVIEFGFDVLNLRRISARCMVENIESKRVMEKCGMRFEGILKDAVFAKGEYKDVFLYSITKPDYQEKCF